jgi:hypothetical protein
MCGAVSFQIKISCVSVLVLVQVWYRGGGEFVTCLLPGLEKSNLAMALLEMTNILARYYHAFLFFKAKLFLFPSTTSVS